MNQNLKDYVKYAIIEISYRIKEEDIMNKNLLTYHQRNRYTDIFATERLQGKLKHVEAVIKTANTIADFQHAEIDRELLSVLAEHHDDGRVDQYRLLGKFLDTEVSHNVLGIDRVDKFITHYKLEVDAEMQLLRNVMMYHGRQHLAPQLSAEEKAYIDLVTAADDFENACSCVSYLIREVENDEKGYIKSNPEADQKAVTSDFIWYSYAIGKKFGKMQYCKTYADYILFAGTLATSCIQRYNEVAKTALMQPGYGYSSILEGFKVTFEKTLTEVDAERAYNMLHGMLN